jgi:3-phosphoshikimate 1-carboxyvinyltransferase
VKALPDILEIQPLAKPPNCTIMVPGSKSITNRALILAALWDGECTLRGALWADDTQRMVEALWELDFEVNVEPDPLEECNRTITVVGRGGKIPAKKAELFVGNAGTAARFLTALVCLGHGEYTIHGDERMHERPMGELFRALRQWGADIDADDDRLPATVSVERLRPKSIEIATSESTQFASALLMIERAAGATGNISFKNAPDEYGYISMTTRLMDQFDPDFRIEPDLSSASYFVAAAHLCGGTVEVADWPGESLQIDGEFPSVLREAAEAGPGEPVFTLSRSAHLGDSAMTLAICAPFLPAGLKLMDAANMRQQETDRVTALVTELRRVGAQAEEHEDGLTVKPAEPGQLHGADIETYNDHRMAMCFSVLGLKVPGIRIKNPSCVSKTFPNFFEKLEQLRQA